MKNIGPKLRKLRVIENKKQEELADLLGIKQQQYSKMERNDVKNIKIEHLQTLCRFYSIPLTNLLDE